MTDEQPSAAQPSIATPKAPEPKKKTGRIIGIFVFLWAFWMGWHGWESYSSKSDEAKRAQWQDKTIAPRMALLRQKLGEIESRPVKNADDYIANTLEISPIVEEAKGLDRRQMEMIGRFKQTYQDNAGDMRMADYMTRLSETDDHLILLIGDEVDCAKAMRDLPASKRLDYYNANVPRIKEKEAQVMKTGWPLRRRRKRKGFRCRVTWDRRYPEQTPISDATQPAGPSPSARLSGRVYQSLRRR
jgi:hypothetical protein